LLDNPKELLELINYCLKPKTVEKKAFGEVFTPMDFINDKMLFDIETYWSNKNNENIWTNENLTWYDPASGMGNYPIAIYYKLIDGLKNKIPNENERKKHIIEKQLFMGELNKKNCFVIKQIFNINNKHKLNLYEGDTLNINLEETFGIYKFDIIIGNPPYNGEFKGKNGYATPLFNKFTEYYMNKCKMLSFIIPLRWFVGGMGLDNFLLFMTNRNDIVYIKNYINSQDIFGSTVIIKGGVNYFLKNEDHNDKCLFNNSYIELKKYDIIIDNKYVDIINKILKYNSIIDLYHSKGYYGISLTDKRLSPNKKENDIICYISQIKGFVNYIDKNNIDKNKLKNYKIITVTASTEYGGFGNMFIGEKDDIHSESYISFNVNSKIEADSLLSYLKTKFTNFLLKLRKVTHNISKNTCKWIPLPPLDREWNDNDVYKYFELSDDEIEIIKNEKISGYKDLKTNKKQNNKK
jgi:site-specific DNA-methyltransferase (adenine-specific)